VPEKVVDNSFNLSFLIFRANSVRLTHRIFRPKSFFRASLFYWFWSRTKGWSFYWIMALDERHFLEFILYTS